MGFAGGIAVAGPNGFYVSTAVLQLAMMNSVRQFELYPLLAHGAAAPTCLVTDPGIAAGLWFAGKATFYKGNIWAQVTGPSPNNLPTIKAYSGCGNAPPVATLSGSKTGFDNGSVVTGLAFDGLGHLYVSDTTGSAAPGSVQIFFGPNFNGNLAPNAVLRGKLTQITNPMGVAIGP
jgi:hypothetical protein